MATHEVTVTQFKKFTAGYVRNRVFTPEADCPANSVTWFGAAAYCNWLSQQEGIPKEAVVLRKEREGRIRPRYENSSRTACDALGIACQPKPNGSTSVGQIPAPVFRSESRRNCCSGIPGMSITHTAERGRLAG